MNVQGMNRFTATSTKILAATALNLLLLIGFALPQQACCQATPTSPRTSTTAETPREAAVQENIIVTNSEQFKNALHQLNPGTTISIAPGHYAMGIFLKNVHGSREKPIVITGADPDKPPIFEGQGEGAKLSSCSYIKLANLVFRGFAVNGINIADDGSKERREASHHIILEKIVVEDIGPTGNHDALKMSGVDHFVVRNCRFEGWGGSAIDLVGCHHGVIENCRFIGRQGYRTANGVQIKGGSRHVLVQTSTFRNAGRRSINLGGATGLQYFRPLGTDYEAIDITIAGNTFIGGDAQIAWVTAQDGRVAHNLFYLPGKWLGRIVQESEDPRFLPCQHGRFENNLVVTDERVVEYFGVGAGTRPESFVFRGNAWFRAESPGRPQLPTPESDGIYDLDPIISLLPSGELVAKSTDPRLKTIGPWAYIPWWLEKEFGDVDWSSIDRVGAQHAAPLL